MEPLHEAFRDDCREYEHRTKRNAIKQLIALHGYKQSTAYAWGEGDDAPAVRIPALAVQQMAGELGQYRTVKALCRNVGGLFVRLPQGAATTSNVLELIREWTEASQAAAEALQDGAVSVGEYERYERELDEAISKGLELKQYLRAERDKGAAR